MTQAFPKKRLYGGKSVKLIYMLKNLLSIPEHKIDKLI